MNSRQKGAAGERELSRILREYGYNTRRGQQYSGANGDADVVGLPGIHIECKRVERLNISDAMVQSIGDARPGEMPTVFHRKNCEPWKTTMLTSDWLKLYGNQRQEWIWCRDRLPEEGRFYIAAYKFDDEKYIKCHELYYGFADGEIDPGWYIDDDCERLYKPFTAIAWMPLPTPPEECHE